MASSTRSYHEGERHATIDESHYFRWLAHKIHTSSRSSYWGLFRKLHDTEFVWIVPNDDNRIMDGLDLRVQFCAEHRLRREDLAGPCSVLEVTVALSRHLAWKADGAPEVWAWQLLCNLGLHKFRDPLSARKVRQVDEILYALIWRQYNPDGNGGFFPLTKPREDQRQVEIWYQMAAYVLEIHPEY